MIFGFVGFSGWRTRYDPMFEAEEEYWRVMSPRALRNSSSIRHIPFTKASLSKEPKLLVSHSFLEKLFQSLRLWLEVNEIHHMVRSLLFSRRDELQTILTTLPFSRSFGPTISSTFDCSAFSGCARPNDGSSADVIRSTDNPRHPAACLLFFASE
jgi:hypothetical protein